MANRQYIDYFRLHLSGLNVKYSMIFIFFMEAVKLLQLIKLKRPINRKFSDMDSMSFIINYVRNYIFTKKCD